MHCHPLSFSGVDFKRQNVMYWVNLTNFLPLRLQHPENFRDEEVFSPDLDDLEVEDCCGILRQGENGLVYFPKR
jgi:hypothetical protein